MATDATRRRAAATLAAAIILSGCAAAPPAGPTDAAATERETARLTQGYSLLYELVSKQTGVAMLLILKPVPDDTAALVRRIAATCRDAKAQLESLARADADLRLDEPGLPDAERATRDAIERETGGRLLAAGADFETRLLQTQVESMNYGSHLAATTAKLETDPERRPILEQLAKRLGRLRDDALDRLIARRAKP